MLLYNSTSTSSSVNKFRKELFSKKGRLPDDIPPTTVALELHIYRAIYQAFLFSTTITHCRIHMNGARKWKINITKLYRHSFRRFPKCLMDLFVLAANITMVVKNVVNVFKHLFCALDSITMEVVVNNDYFSSLFLILQKIF